VLVAGGQQTDSKVLYALGQRRSRKFGKGKNAELGDFIIVGHRLSQGGFHFDRIAGLKKVAQNFEKC